MLNFPKDQDVTLKGFFSSGKEPIIPDTGSVTYSVWDHSGAPIVGLVDLPLSTGPTTFQYEITISAIYNTISSGRIFSRRTLVISYLKNGATAGITQTYRLVPNMNYTVSPRDIRAFIGINTNELPDEDIDLMATYLMVNNDFGGTYLQNALVSGTISEVYANDAIAMRTVMEVIPSLQARVAQSEKNGVMGYERLKILDFSSLLAAAYARYFRNRDLVVAIGTIPIDMVLITTTQDADPVTGA